MSNNTKNIVSQSFALIVSGLVIVFLLLWGIDSFIIDPTFKALEDQQTIENGNRVKSAIQNKVDILGGLANDWAYWDDTYAFAKKPNPAYIESNYPDPEDVSYDSKVDLLIIFDTTGKILLQGNYHPELQRQVDLDILAGDDPQILSIIAPTMSSEKTIDGVLLTNQGMIILVARPILESQGDGLSRGVLVMGRFLTQTVQNNLATAVNVQFDLLRQDAEQLPLQERAIISSLTAAFPDVQYEFSRSFLYQAYLDIKNKPSIILRNQSQVKILKIGEETSFLLRATLLIISCLLLVCLAIYRARMKIFQRSLQESEERYRTLFANKHIVMFLIDPKTTEIVDANSAASKYYGWSIEELKRMEIGDLNVLSREDIFSQMNSAKAGKHNYFLFKHRKADGSICDVEVHSGPLNIKGKPLLYSIVHDITARIQAEDALQESNACLQTIMNSLDAVIYIADMQSHELLFVNKYARKLLGQNITGKKCWVVLQGQDGPCSFCTNDKLVDENNKPTGVFRWEFQNLMNHRWYDIADHAIQWIDGRMVRMEIATDITDRKQEEAKQFNIDRQIQQKNKVESLGRMAGAVAHHYNNLLGAVLGNLELAMIDLTNTDGLEKNLIEAMSAANRAAEIGRLMLAYLGQVPTKREPLDLAETCYQKVITLKTSLPKRLTIETTLPIPGPIINGNADQIKQILRNLLTNASEAMEDTSGIISVSTQIVSYEEIPVQHHYPVDFLPEATDYACLQIIDEGEGISEDNISKIFDPFFSTKFTGRGLGLPVVIGIVKSHHGCISVESEIEKGSIFRVFLPLSISQHVKHKSQDLKNIGVLKQYTVLVVEDEPLVSEMTEHMLTIIGTEVLLAKDGVEAIEIFRQNRDKICCVLSDLTMPRMGGWETLAALREISPKIPVILTSGYDQAQVMSDEHPEMPQAFLRKPYGVNSLKNALNLALEDSDFI